MLRRKNGGEGVGGEEPHTPGGTKCVLRVGGEPRKTAPTHPPSAVANFGRAAVRDASAIPCRGALGVRAERRVGTLRRYHPGWCLTGAKASTVWRLFFLLQFAFFVFSVREVGCGSDPEGTASYLAHIKSVGPGSVTTNITQRAATHHAAAASNSKETQPRRVAP